MTNGNGAPPEAAPVQLNVLVQYIKDMSFENPNAPRTYAPQQTQPQINIQINVNVNNASETDYEVILKIEGKAELGTLLLFSFELSYGGIFRIQNVPQDSMHAFVMIECPRAAKARPR